ncbi:beta-channel forming cytolysin [Staphylococcus sp. HGB0015]|uniref:Beta-channel forming cytolysin n=1 Tax=Staphylococcus schleiferi TaxID=1295 RepID=A0ABX0G194_STASC|nr:MULTISPECIES: beta-channel forming cytolysin [Staphylococcus]QGS45734.1 beta-channel forming cytolysin [Mammaliicoccus fleurettii]EPD50941.1 beta-channel forming cytolysin [Staphylococcus sp. HGB0015]NHA35107.1 beta-channel forming cytolysin [Staphylococcus schleiferi]NHA37835.1 beta-channel forming cytolysin [Staphylococcus schleiferi]NHA40200.1 beta-channel forming cytolysin [Staphylococcus schleiferi]
MKKSRLLKSVAIFSLMASFIVAQQHEVLAASAYQDIGDNAQVIKRTKDISSHKWGVTQNIQFDFIKDPKYNKDALIVKTQGFVKSRTRYQRNRQLPYIAQMLWPFQYNVALKVDDQNASIINFLPKNRTDSIDVKETLGYTIGGSFKTDSSLNINGSSNYTKTISYNQSSYVSEVANQNSKNVAWAVKANEFNIDGTKVSAYDKFLFFGGNSIRNKARDFFVSDSELPPLVLSGFNPAFLTTISHDPNTSETSQIEISLGRNLDVTSIWRQIPDSHASYIDASRAHNAFTNRNFIVKYEINWKTHEIKVKG